MALGSLHAKLIEVVVGNLLPDASNRLWLQGKDETFLSLLVAAAQNYDIAGSPKFWARMKFF